jgi:putative flavoprotein involved in K+ transport
MLPQPLSASTVEGESYMTEQVDTMIVGAGQAGLSMSYWLTAAGREHLLLERGQVGERWRSERWDTLTVLAPNWMVDLPGHPYAGNDPDGFMGKDEVITSYEDYAREFRAPVRTNVTVRSVKATESNRFEIQSDAGTFEATNVIAATGPYQQPSIPVWNGTLPSDIYQVHSTHYRNPAQLPPGAVLVVGSAASGQQIAEELLAAGRRVYLSVGYFRPAYRRYRGRDWARWQCDAGAFDRIVDGFSEKPLGFTLTGPGSAMPSTGCTCPFWTQPAGQSISGASPPAQACISSDFRASTK